MNINMLGIQGPYPSKKIQSYSALSPQIDLSARLSDSFSNGVDNPVYFSEWKTIEEGQQYQDGYSGGDIHEQYLAWKEQQPKIEVPNCNGWSNANMQFLEKHFGSCDDLPIFRRMQLVDTMKEMGIIDEADVEDAYLTSKLITLTDPEDICSTRAKSIDPIDPIIEARDRFLSGKAIKDITTLEDALKWAESR